MELYPGGIIAWLVVGILAGWLTGQVMKGSGYGLLMDLVIGVVGAFVGAVLLGLLFPGNAVGFLGSIVVAFIGGCLLVAMIRALPGRSAV